MVNLKEKHKLIIYIGISIVIGLLSGYLFGIITGYSLAATGLGIVQKSGENKVQTLKVKKKDVRN